MTCVELQESLAEIEDAGAAEQRAHLKCCDGCFALVTELNLIVSAAVDLREANERSPRVWNSIEITLRQEGLIHAPRSRHSLIPSFGSRWEWSRWMIPAAVVLLLTLGLYVRRISAPKQIAEETTQTVVSDLAVARLNYAHLLHGASAPPAIITAQYENSLHPLNDNIPTT